MRKANWRRGALTVLKASTAILLLEAVPAMAQDAPTQPAADTAQNGDIVVTATKRSESIQRVPISIQALTPAVLEQHQVTTFDDFAKLLPSVSYQTYGPSQAQITFRGVATGGIDLPGGSLSAAGYYLDEIPVTTIGALLDIHIYDVARIEALAGPQGTLFGASSLAGTVRIITNKPDTHAFSAGYDLQGNKFGKGAGGGTAEGYINVPLSPAVAVRAVGFYEHDGGYIDNTLGTRVYTLSDSDPTNDKTVTNSAFVKKDFNDVDTYGGRIALGIDLDDNWTVTPTVIAQHQISHGTFGYDPRAGDLKVHEFAPDRNLDKWYQAALTIQGKLSNFDVVYSGGYLQRTIDNQQDYSYYTVYYDNIAGYTNFPDGHGGFLDPTQRYHNNQALTKMTHELRVSSPSTDRLRFTVGAFMQRQTNYNQADYYVPGLAATGSSLPVVGDDIFRTQTHIIDRDYAMFGQASFDIVKDLTLTAGIRGFIANNTLTGFSGFASNAASAGCAVPITESCISVNKKYDQSGETHKVSLSWQIDPTHMIYATYATGFRPGGNNRRAGINPYVADTLDNYEIGWKTSWFDHRFLLNGAVYYEKWHNLQYALAPIGAVGVTNIYNAGDARIWGAEANAQLNLGGLTLSGNAAYTDAKLTTDFCQIGADGNPDCAGGVIAAPKGTRLPVQPKFKGTATARYTVPIGVTKSFVQASMLHQSGVRNFLGVADDASVGDTKPFTTFDFSVGATFSNMSVELFLQNAFDERGTLSRNTFCPPTYCGTNARSYPIKPQEFGIKFGQHF